MTICICLSNEYVDYFSVYRVVSILPIIINKKKEKKNFDGFIIQICEQDYILFYSLVFLRFLSLPPFFPFLMSVSRKKQCVFCLLFQVRVVVLTVIFFYHLFQGPVHILMTCHHHPHCLIKLPRRIGIQLFLHQ